MRTSAYDKMVAELSRCGWETLPITNKVWISEGSFKDRNEINIKIMKLQKEGVSYASTHTNYKGTTIWAEREGIVLRMVRLAKYREAGGFRMVAEFTKNGAFIRGYSHTDTPYIPNRTSGWNRRSVGETITELMFLIQLSSPENLAKLKERDIEQTEKKLQEALDKKAEYEEKVQNTKNAVVDLIKKCATFPDVFEDILQKGLLVLPYKKGYDEREIEEAKEELAKLQG